MKPAAAPRFENAAMRARYERAYEELMRDLPVDRAESLVARFHELEAQLDEGMIEVKSALLVSSLLTTDEDHALGGWILRQHANLARLGRCVVEMSQGAAGVAETSAVRALALTFLHWGEAVKWELMVGRSQQRDHALLHGLMRMALALGVQERVEDLVVEGQPRRARVEALYWRTLILDRFTSGSLTRQEIEVLDAWLWEWTPLLRHDPEAELVWRADLDSDVGLRYGRRRGPGPSLYLALAPLQERRGAIIERFHQGYIVPEQGRAAEIRIESHVAVLAQLRKTFSGTESRDHRHALQPAEVEAWVGMAEVTRALETHDRFAGAPAAEAADEAPRDTYDRIYDKKQRFLTVRDTSYTGYLAEAPAAAAQDIQINEVVALRTEPGEPPVVTRVARRVLDAERGIVSFGLELLCDASLQPRVAKLAGAKGAADAYIFVPGADESGRHDGFIVPYRVLLSGEPLRLAADAHEYTLAFNRVRRHGRGWVMAGFEIQDAKQASPAPA